MDDWTAILTVGASIGGAISTAIGMFFIQKSKLKHELKIQEINFKDELAAQEIKFKNEFEHDVKGIRTQKTAEDIARQLLEQYTKPKRKFTTIRHFLKGFDDDELRKILIRAGGVSFDGKVIKKVVMNGQDVEIKEELWGLIERNEDDVFPK